MKSVVKVTIAGLALGLLAGCVGPSVEPTAPMGYSLTDMSALTGVPMTLPGNQSQCAQSSATMADPTSTANERYGATMAGRANGCPGF